MGLQTVKSELAKRISGQVETAVPMQKFTTWRVGGPADLLVWAHTSEDVQQAIGIAKQHALPWQVIGNGSNLLVLDQGIRGLVIKLAGQLAMVDIQGDQVVAGAGVLLPKLARAFVQAGLSGLEFAAGIPGSLGGAVIMNAGAHGNCLGDLVEWVELVDDQGEIQLLNKQELTFDYRFSSLKAISGVVTKVGLKGYPGDIVESRQVMATNLSRRRNTQPLSLPNAGSVFKNPQGFSAGRLIEQAGGKGLRVGDAMVSERHANFIVNLGHAKASDILTLIEKVQSLVEATSEIKLELEVLVMGE